ncbi:hypothetical protein BU17DRAFT_90626 [Hysterangium stoloniferum]|nr:hypothetical protein BU17DRAFT_90626 [Hysterangium stoloniferum]
MEDQRLQDEAEKKWQDAEVEEQQLKEKWEGKQKAVEVDGEGEVGPFSPKSPQAPTYLSLDLQPITTRPLNLCGIPTVDPPTSQPIKYSQTPQDFHPPV